METEKRNHQRHKPKEIPSGITLTANDKEIAINADIMDISYSGIRVKLKKPISSHINKKVKITMILPESKTPFTVHGILKYQAKSLECGIHYTDHVEGSINDLMFECIALDRSTVLIKSL